MDVCPSWRTFRVVFCRLPVRWLTVYRDPLISIQFLFHAVKPNGILNLLRCYQREGGSDGINIRDVAGGSDSVIRGSPGTAS